MRPNRANSIFNPENPVKLGGNRENSLTTLPKRVYLRGEEYFPTIRFFGGFAQITPLNDDAKKQ
jgi:hypothetical protein